MPLSPGFDSGLASASVRHSRPAPAESSASTARFLRASRSSRELLKILRGLTWLMSSRGSSPGVSHCRPATLAAGKTSVRLAHSDGPSRGTLPLLRLTFEAFSIISVPQQVLRFQPSGRSAVGQWRFRGYQPAKLSPESFKQIGCEKFAAAHRRRLHSPLAQSPPPARQRAGHREKWLFPETSSECHECREWSLPNQI